MEIHFWLFVSVLTVALNLYLYRIILVYILYSSDVFHYPSFYSVQVFQDILFCISYTIWYNWSIDFFIVVVFYIEDFPFLYFYHLWEPDAIIFIIIKCVNIFWMLFCSCYLFNSHHHVHISLLTEQIEGGSFVSSKTSDISLEADVSTNFDLPLSFKCQLILLGTAHWCSG